LKIGRPTELSGTQASPGKIALCKQQTLQAMKPISPAVGVKPSSQQFALVSKDPGESMAGPGHLNANDSTQDCK
jgi:hypothetical protein